MKKLITYISLLATGIILFPSCKSGLDITKRHYNSGYYFAHSKSKHTVPVTKEEEKTVQSKTVQVLSPAQKEAEKGTTNNVSGKVVVVTAVAPETNTKKTRFKAGPKNVADQVQPHAKISESPLSKLKSALTETKKVKSIPGEREALSLLWIIILVVLILWIFGFIAGGWGLGGFINLLLLIAAILLVLWLLRVL